MHKAIFTLGLIFFLRLGFAQEKEFVNSIGMEFVRIEPGTFNLGEFSPPYPVPEDTIKSIKHKRIMWMGDGRGYSTEDFENAKKLALQSADPGFSVLIGSAFYIGKFEVTQAQWKAVMGNNPSVFTHDSLGNTDRYPVENVAMKDIKRFLKRLNRKEKTKSYRLPTEIEWEYAARAGREKDIPWNLVVERAQLGKQATQPVGMKAPNEWGIYDVLGNVWELVSDYYNEKIFAEAEKPKRSKQRVLKGASIAGDVKNATYMTHAGTPGNGWDVGFRVLMEIKE